VLSTVDPTAPQTWRSRRDPVPGYPHSASYERCPGAAARNAPSIGRAKREHVIRAADHFALTQRSSELLLLALSREDRVRD